MIKRIPLFMDFHNFFAKLTICAVLCFCLPFFSQAQENSVVTKIEFYGNHHFTKPELLRQVSMYTRSWFQKTIKRKSPFLFSREILENDLDRLLIFYQKEGYLHANVKIREIKKVEKDKVEIHIQIDENEPVFVKELVFNHENSIPDSAWQQALSAIEPKLNLKKNTLFKDRLFHADKQFIINYFQNIGYPYIKINSTLKITNTNELNLSWEIVSGLKCVFSQIVQEGNNKVQSSFINKLIPFKTGDVYNQQLMEKTQENLYATGLFQIVSLQANLEPQQNTKIPVTVYVKESPQKSIKFGAGYGREDRFRVFCRFQRIGLFNSARRAIINFKHSYLEPYHLDVAWHQPMFLYHKTNLVINPFIQKEKEPGYVIEEFGVDVPVQIQFSQHLNGTIGYTFERVKHQLLNNMITETQLIQDNQLYNKSSINWSMTYDNSFPLFSPETGSYTALNLKYSGLGLKSTFHFTKILFEHRRYIKTYQTVFAWRIKTGAVTSRDAHNFIPYEDRFFSGGAYSVRGWLRAQLGPKKNGIPTGGNGLFEQSIEWRFPIIGPLSGVVFYDMGNVWNSASHISVNEIRYAAGGGLRYKTPIGPVRIDLGRPVWDNENNVQIHISVGQAF